MPMRPAELGTVRLMNLIADCSTTQGSRGSGVGTAPRNETPRGDEGELGDDQPDDDPGELGARRSSWAIVPKPISASWVISR